MKRPREAYVRVTVKYAALVECIIGLELRQGEGLGTLYDLVEGAGKQAISGMVGATDLELAEAIERRLLLLWPERAYFIEVGRGPLDRFIQLFQPWGVPREREEPVLLGDGYRFEFEAIDSSETDPDAFMPKGDSGLDAPNECGCSSEAHPNSFNLLAGAAEREGRTCRMGWPL